MDKEYKTEGDRDSKKLVHYLRILLKRKFLLLSIICVVVVIIGGISLIKPRLSTMETILEIGQVGGQSVESPIQVVEKINDGTYLSQPPAIKANYIDNTDLIHISTDVQDTDKGKEILNVLTSNIIQDHKAIIMAKRDFLEKELGQFTARQQIAENAFEKGATSFSMNESAQFLVLNSIQAKIDSLQEDINADRKILDAIRDTQVIKPPTASSTSSRYRDLVNIILAVILGLFLGIFIVLVKEWWEVIFKRT